MMNFNRYSKKIFLMTGVSILIVAGTVSAAEDSTNTEYQVKPVEIQGAPVKKIREKLNTGPVQKIEEQKWEMPEVPKKITRKGLNPAEKTQLAALEQKKAAGKTTETEYQIEKDTLARDSNIKF